MPGRSSRSGAMPLSGRETTPELEARLASLAAEVVPAELGRGRPARSSHGPRTSGRRRSCARSDGRMGWIDWSRGAVDLDRRVRALQPWPGAWTTVDGRRLHVRRAHPLPGFDNVPIGALLPGDPVRVACGRGALGLELVQPEGRAPMDALAWRNGLQRQHVLLGVD